MAVLIRMKLAILRNSMTGGRAAWMVTGGLAGVLCAAATVALTLVDLDRPGVQGDLLACVWAMWTLGWVAGPLWSGSVVLRADHFALVPVPRRRLAAGLLGAAFAGIGAAVTALAFFSLITYAVRLGALPALVAVPAAALELVFVVLLSRLAYALFGAFVRSRTGAAITGVLLGAMITLTQSAWMIVVAVAYSDVLATGFSAGFSAALRAVPSSWGVVAVEAAARGDWPRSVGALAGLALLVALLLLAWAHTLGAPRRSAVTVRGSAHRAAPARGPFAGPTGAIFVKELRTRLRDPLHWSTVTMPVAWALLTVLLPLTFDVKLLLPWAGPAVAWFAVTVGGNLYGSDGTALWLTLMTGTQRPDVRARQWAYLAVFGPIAVALGIGCTLWAGYPWAWPWVAATVPALLGGGAGLVAYASVAALVPGPDAHRRPGNALESADSSVWPQVLFWVGALPAVPAVAVVLLGELLDSSLLRWAGGPAGLATGAALAWWLGRAAAVRLEARGPELLARMRAGGAPAAAPEPETKAEVPPRDVGIAVVCLVAGALLLFPQGLVPLVFLLTGVDVRVWFLAMYLPAGWGLASATLSVLIGAVLWVKAFRIMARTGRVERAESSS